VNKKGISTLVIVAIIVVAVVVIGAIAAYVWYSGGTPEATPTPEPTPDIEGATSIRFDVNATVDGNLEIDRFTAKNLGTSNVLLRVDQTDKDGVEFIYLMNQTGQTVWVNYAGTWMDDSANFATQYWNNNLIGNTALESYMTALANWSGTGNYEGDSYIISNIVVDPTIDDSAFQPPS
jgi:FlaG/FlaF family flagellin (archaellin)